MDGDELATYVMAHTMRGECRCGRCIDRGAAPDPDGHTVSTGFFQVSATGDPDRVEFLRLVRAHKGEYGACNPLDHHPHSFIELGGWVGDQGIAMQLMALGKLLGVWEMFAKEGEGCVIIALPLGAPEKADAAG